jgi:hypothetical protein
MDLGVLEFRGVVQSGKANVRIIVFLISQTKTLDEITQSKNKKEV